MSEEVSGMDLISTASGVVLDLGPGAGYLLRLFDPQKVTAIYGVEPAMDLHPELAAEAKAAGLGSKYKPLIAGAEPESLLPALAKAGLFKNGSEGIFDTIVCVRVLCGVRQKDTVPSLYRLLKPGGRMIISEHVTSPWPRQGKFLGFFFQKLFTLLGWKFWLGCSMEQDTVSALREAASTSGWDTFDLKYENPWHPVPFVVGTLTKSYPKQLFLNETNWTSATRY
jgi:SAM-dependent methyltransferase